VDRLIKQHGETFVKKTGSVAIEFFITKKEQKLLGVSGQEQLGEL
jgi:peptide subunit release factor 1 (eRF1)